MALQQGLKQMFTKSAFTNEDTIKQMQRTFILQVIPRAGMGKAD